MDIDYEESRNHVVVEKVLLKDVFLHKFDVCREFIIFTTWDSNKINAYSFKNKKIIEITTLSNENSFVMSMKILKDHNKTKYLSISISDGTLLIYKIDNSINIFCNYFSSTGRFV